MEKNNRNLGTASEESRGSSSHLSRILVAEDNIINQKLILRILQSMGIEPDIAQNGMEVLEAMEKKNYSLILMDIQMPKMDGIQATKEIIEKYATGKRPKIIAVTACAARGDKERFLAVGMDDYIGKPIDIIQFQDRILYWLNLSNHRSH